MRVLFDSTILLSGLFFAGNERRLLQKALEGKFTAVLPESIITETLEKIAEKFSGYPNAALARAFFAAIIAKAEIVPESEAQNKFDEAKSMIRDLSDAPNLAAALAANPDILVTSDSDYYALKKPVPFRILKAWQLLKELEN